MVIERGGLLASLPLLFESSDIVMLTFLVECLGWLWRLPERFTDDLRRPELDATWPVSVTAKCSIPDYNTMLPRYRATASSAGAGLFSLAVVINSGNSNRIDVPWPGMLSTRKEKSSP